MLFLLPTISLVLALFGVVLAAPHTRRENWGTGAGYTKDIEIHQSCNATERRQLTKALQETYEIAQVAKNCKLLSLLELLKSGR